jgi:hypothetical protein
MTALDIQLIQDTDTNFIVYDGTDRTLCPNAGIIPVNDLTGVTIKFTDESDFLTETKTFIFDSTKKGIHRGTVDVSLGHDWYPVPNHQYLLLSYQNGETFTIPFQYVTTTTIQEIVDYINVTVLANIPELNGKVEAVVNGNYVDLQTVGTGGIEFFTIVGGNVLDVFGWTTGTYRGNGINWGAMTSQEEFIYWIYANDFGMGWEEIPEGNWYVEITSDYTTPIVDVDQPFVQTYQEFTFKQSENYWARLYETIANDPNSYLDFEYRKMTNPEKFIFYTAEYDARMKALKAAISVGNVDAARDLVLYCQNARTLNPID